VLYFCIPAFNEAPTVGLLLWRLRKVFQEQPREYEVLVYDDGSTDATAETLEPYHKVMPLTVLGGTRVGYARAVDALCRRHGLLVCDVELVPIHGGSLRLFIAHAGQPQSARVVELLAKEKSEGLLTFEHYRDFGDRVARLKQQLLALLQRLKGEGRRIAAYGASAKGSTLMNAFGIDRTLIEFVVDRSNLKQGRFTPGNHLPILPPEALLERRPEYVLLLTWNFSAEILAQQSEFRRRGGKFIVPVPEVTVA